MAPNLTEDEIDDLLYLARTGENDELSEDITKLAAREGVSAAEILTAAKDESKATCLHMATGNGHLGMPPPSIHPPCCPSTTPPQDCPSISNPPCPPFHTPLLLQYQPNIPAPQRQTNRSTKKETVNLLLSHFADAAAKNAYLDAANDFGNTALHWAALGGHLETVRSLMDAGAAPALANQGDFVPLDLALSKGHQRVVDLFFERGRTEGETGEGLEGAVEGVELNGEDGEKAGEGSA